MAHSFVNESDYIVQQPQNVQNAPNINTGMYLRNRQLQGVVPVVRRQGQPPAPPAMATLSTPVGQRTQNGLWASAKRRLSGLFNASWYGWDTGADRQSGTTDTTQSPVQQSQPMGNNMQQSQPMVSHGVYTGWPQTVTLPRASSTGVPGVTGNLQSLPLSPVLESEDEFEDAMDSPQPSMTGQAQQVTSNNMVQNATPQPHIPVVPSYTTGPAGTHGAPEVLSEHTSRGAPEVLSEHRGPTQSAGIFHPVSHVMEGYEPVVNHNYSNCTFKIPSGPGTPSASSAFYKPKIPTFNEDDGWETYLSNFQAITAGWPEQAKLNALREKLTGQALRVLSGLDMSGGVVGFPALVEAITRHYVGERSDWVARLSTITREEGESLDDLAHRIKVWSIRAYGIETPDSGLYMYLALRSTPIGDRLVDFKDLPLDVVLRKAKTYESHLRSNNRLTGETTPAAVAVTPATPTQQAKSLSREGVRANYEQPLPIPAPQQPATQQQQSGIQSGFNTPSPRGRGRGGGGSHRGGRYGGSDRRFIRTCHVCGSEDHLWRQCPQVGVPAGTSRPPQQPRNPNLCRICREGEHPWQSCPLVTSYQQHGATTTGTAQLNKPAAPQGQ